VDLVRDPVVKLNSKDGNAWNSPIDLTGVLDINTTDESSSIDIATDNDDSNEDTTEALLVSDNQNININDSSSDIAADDSNMTTTEQPPPPPLRRSRTYQQRWSQRSPNQLTRS